MPILDAALAFALTMLFVATLVTQIVYLAQKLTRRRSEEFARMLGEYCENELRPVIERERHRLRADAEGVSLAGLETASNKLSVENLLPQGEALGERTELSTQELEESLKRSQLGLELLATLGSRAQPVFDALGERYEALGDRYTEAFRRQSRRWATWTALLLALTLNIDSLFIAGLYVNSPAARHAVIADSAAIVDGYEKLEAELEAGEREAITLEQLRAAIDDGRRQVGTLGAAPFPVGWRHFPHALWSDDASAALDRHHPFGWIGWLLGVLATAYFAGLGAPFWYDAVTGIRRAVQRTSERS